MSLLYELTFEQLLELELETLLRITQELECGRFTLAYSEEITVYVLNTRGVEVIVAQL